MGSFSITHWLILLVVVVVVFGTAKLKNAGKDQVRLCPSRFMVFSQCNIQAHP